MKKDIKLVAIDLDGTLLNSEKDVLQENIDMIKKLKEDNIQVVIATGRPAAGFSWIRKKANLMGEDDYSITNTGSLVIKNSNNKPVISYCLDIDDFSKAKKLTDEFGLQIHIYNRNGLYSPFKDPDEFIKWDARLLKMDVLGLDEKNFTDPIERITITGQKEVLDKFQEKYDKQLQKTYTTTRSMDIIYELTNQKASKGKALVDLCKYLNINIKQVLVIGDSENDKSMLNLAGFSACPKNASDSVKEIVDFVSDKSNDEAGVSHILENFFL